MTAGGLAVRFINLAQYICAGRIRAPHIALYSMCFAKRLTSFFCYAIFYSERANAWGVGDVSCGLRHVQHLRDPFFFCAHKGKLMQNAASAAGAASVFTL